MINDFTITVDYKNRDMQTVNRRVWTLDDYTMALAGELKRLIMDVENLAQDATGLQKNNWSPVVADDFARLRHKLLDAANAVDRLPDALCYKGMPVMNVSASKKLAEAFNLNDEQFCLSAGDKK